MLAGAIYRLLYDIKCRNLAILLFNIFVPPKAEYEAFVYNQNYSTYNEKIDRCHRMITRISLGRQLPNVRRWHKNIPLIESAKDQYIHNFPCILRGVNKEFIGFGPFRKGVNGLTLRMYGMSLVYMIKIRGPRNPWGGGKGMGCGGSIKVEDKEYDVERSTSVL